MCGEFLQQSSDNPGAEFSEILLGREVIPRDGCARPEDAVVRGFERGEAIFDVAREGRFGGLQNCQAIDS